MDQEVFARLQRIYAVIGATIEKDLSQFRPTARHEGKGVVVHFDFRGTLSDEQISNIAHIAIHNVANLGNHLRKWAARVGKDPQIVENAINESFPLRVVIDLSNNDKHGYPPRDGGRSRKAPKLVDLCRLLNVSAGPEPGSQSSVVFSLGGPTHIQAEGSASVIVSGRVVGQDGEFIGNLEDFLLAATAAWDDVLSKFGIGGAE